MPSSISPLRINKQHSSYGDCLEVKREYYQNCSVLDCVTQCSQSAAHLYQLVFFSALTLVGLVLWPVKIVPEMTYNVLSGTLSLYTTLSDACICKLHLYILAGCGKQQTRNDRLFIAMRIVCHCLPKTFDANFPV